MYKASVVIPNYNGEKYIDECMNALRKQREQSFEVILVDNASEDNSIAAFEAYNDLNIRTITLDENYGFSRAVNEGIKASESEYVILLNNDTHVGKNFVGALPPLLPPATCGWLCPMPLPAGAVLSSRPLPATAAPCR